MYEDYVGMVKLYAGSTPPPNWLFCDGSLLKIQDYTMLNTIIGQTYGGDGQTTFALPNLCDRVCIGTGMGQGLSSYVPGQTGGQNAVTLSTSELPAHSHNFVMSAANGSQSAATPGSNLAVMTIPTGRSQSGVNGFVDLAPNTVLSGGSVGSSGNNQPHDNMQPYLGMNFIICVSGLMPSPQ